MSFLSFFCQGKMHFSIQASIALCITKCRKFKKLNFTMLATTDFSPSYFVEKILLLQAQILYPLRDTKSACQGKIPKTLKTKNAEFGACDFRFAPHQKNRNFFVQKKQRKIYLHCSDFVTRHTSPIGGCRSTPLFVPIRSPCVVKFRHWQGFFLCPKCN